MMVKMRKWFENYWYHYKWRTLIVAFFVVIFTVCVVQMLQKKSYDAYILYSGPKVFSSEQETALTNALRYVVSDYDQNGEINLCLTKLIMMSEEELEEAKAQAEAEGSTLAYNYDTRQRTKDQLGMEMMTGNSYLCFLSEFIYQEYKDHDRFAALADVLGYHPEDADDAFSIKLANTAYGAYFSDAFSCMGENVIVCIRQPNVVDKYAKDAMDEYQNNVEILKKIIEFKVQ
ncbi:MAG: hypothetical protein HFE77_08415 [Clostridiales bacterium]|nr:hypothetical protein [Clostridiales bacterium]